MRDQQQCKVRMARQWAVMRIAQHTSNIRRFASFAPFSFSKRWLIWNNSRPNSSIRSTPDLLDFRFGSGSSSAATEQNSNHYFDSRWRIEWGECDRHLPMSSSVSSELLILLSVLPFLWPLPTPPEKRRSLFKWCVIPKLSSIRPTYRLSRCDHSPFRYLGRNHWQCYYLHDLFGCLVEHHPGCCSWSGRWCCSSM